jgi:hypothetical protein
VNKQEKEGGREGERERDRERERERERERLLVGIYPFDSEAA